MFVHFYIYNLGQNICRLFYFSVQFLFTTSEAEQDYYHQKFNVRVAEQLKTRILGNFKKIPAMLGFDSEYPLAHVKDKFCRFSVKQLQKISYKTFHGKPILLNLVNLSTTHCPRL